MTANFTIDTSAIDIPSSHGSMTFRVKVRGYWSRDSITIYVRRGSYGDTNWKIDISHSSGGRDSKEVESDVEAAMYFGEAMIGVAQYAKELESRFPEFEAKYQLYVAELRAFHEQERLERERAVAADPELGETAAKQAIENLLTSQVIKTTRRGDNWKIEFYKQIRGNISLYMNGVRISKKEAISTLAKMSSKNFQIVA
jgi:hypothetical protein